jgi:hypothetical protein
MFATMEQQVISLWRNAGYLCLGVLGLKLFDEGHQLVLGTGTQKKALLAPGANQLQRERLVGRTRLKPGFHRSGLPFILV